MGKKIKLIIEAEIPDDLHGVLDLTQRQPFDQPCPAPDCEGKTYKWVPSKPGSSDSGYVCSFSGRGDCRSCIIARKYLTM